MATSYRETPQQISTMPPGIPYIVGNEAAERFSYYGMSGILFAFLTKFLTDASGQLAPMSPEAAKEWQHYFMAAVYASPILGAILSDWLLGKYRTIVSVSLLYCFGHAALAVMDYPSITHIDPKWMLAFGLILIALGAGGIKPCVTAHVGDQFSKQNEHLIRTVFGWFYFSINFGATFSMLLTPWLLKNPRFGPAWAFGVPGVLMAIATLAFWLGRHKYVHIPPGGQGFFRETFSRHGLLAVANLIPLYLLIFPFFTLFDQTHSSWVEQAESMDRNIFGYTFHPDQFQAVNGMLILILIPIFSYVIYPAMGRLFEVTPLRRIAIGLFLTAASFAIIAVAQQRIDAGAKPHILWQLIAYVVITAGEVMVSITALEFSYTQAPKKMKSFVMGVFFLVAIALGNIFTARVNAYIGSQKQSGSSVLEGANYYWFFTGVMLVTACMFLVYMQFYRGRTYIQGEDQQPAAG
jgi:proton-dependent oligopeptide transporter, POT family